MYNREGIRRRCIHPSILRRLTSRSASPVGKTADRGPRRRHMLHLLAAILRAPQLALESTTLDLSEHARDLYQHASSRCLIRTSLRNQARVKGFLTVAVRADKARCSIRHSPRTNSQRWRDSALSSASSSTSALPLLPIHDLMMVKMRWTWTARKRGRVYATF